jgi:hypothetical protein
MIINHKYKFIYFKTKKTASTTIEIALSKVCTEKDFMTRLIYKDECKRAKIAKIGSTNWRYALKNHATAEQCRRRVPPHVWNTYTKITSVRNTYDMMVSKYFWERNNWTRDFEHWYSKFPDSATANWDIYTINNLPVIDHYIHYENILEDCSRISKILKLPIDIADTVKEVKTKSNARKEQWPPINKQSLEKITEDARHEIEIFNYNIPEEYLETYYG